MLSPSDPLPPTGERPIGDIVSDLVDDGKAYARAEFNLAKAMASAKANALKAPAVLLGAAIFIGMAALNALAVGVVLALDTLMGPLLAGVIAFALIGALAALLGWMGVEKLRNL